MKYTHTEIQKNIEQLSNTLDGLKLERTELTQNINNVKKQIIHWQEFDISQHKMF